MSAKNSRELVEKFIPKECRISTDDLLYKIYSKDLYSIISNLKSNIPQLLLVYICTADYPEKKERFEVIYHLLSLTLNVRITIKTTIGNEEIMQSISSIYKNSTWYEREIWDMYGIPFKGNEDMRRILTDYGFVGHPMRKDFPLTGYTEIEYNHLRCQVEYSNIKLQQDFRNFDSISYLNILHGDEKSSMQKD
jgi:NADH-quinone oxidoreductase subunit C